MGKSLLFKVVKWSRAVRILLGGYTAMEEKQYMYDLPRLLSVTEIRKALIPLCYQYNAFSTTYKKQIWTCRRLDPDGLHQYHLRFYAVNDSIRVSGHWELDPLIEPILHLKGVGLRKLSENEINEIWGVLCR